MFRCLLDARISRSIAFLASIAYAGVALLGYGLHGLTSCNHATPALAHAAGGHACHGHDHHHAPLSDGSSLSSSCDDCSICSLLAQAQSSLTPVAALEGAAPLFAVAAIRPAGTPLAPAEAPQARGPPLG